MGRDRVGIDIVAYVGRRNDPDDERDDELWEELRERVKAIVEDPKYAEITPMVW